MDVIPMAKVHITWKKSTIGFPRDQRRTIAGLGLRRLHQTVEHEDTATIRGMVHKVRHLVEVAEISSSESSSPPGSQDRAPR